MDQSDAEDLLLTSSGLIRQDVDPKHLAKIVNILGRLPLALDQAGVYIRKLHLSLDVFEKHYIDKQKKILQYTPDLFEYRKSLSPGSEPSVLSVFTTWELSLEQLGDDRPHLEHLLTLSAFFDHKKVHEALFSTRCTLNFTACSGVQDGWLQCMLTDSAWDSYRFQDIIATLHGLSLLQKFWIEDGHIVFSLHPLVNDWLRTRAGEKHRASIVVEAAVTVAGTDGSLDFLFHLMNCLHGLSKPLFNDCVDMLPPRGVANGAPEAKLVTDELNLEPRSWQVEALCCPHGRTCQPIPSTVRLLFIMFHRMTGIMLSDMQRQSWRSNPKFSYSSVSNQIPGPLCPKVGPVLQGSHRSLKKSKDRCLEDKAFTLTFDSLKKDKIIFCQSVERSSPENIAFKDVSFVWKQEEDNSFDVRFNIELSEPISGWRAAQLTESTDLTGFWEDTGLTGRPDNLVAIRNELQSLPFLQSGFNQENLVPGTI